MKKMLVAALLASASFAAAAADTYDLEPNHTFPRFAINHLGFSTFHGQFNKTSGTATIDLAKKTGSVDVTIDVASISTGVAKLDEHLQTPDFFDVAKYPTITFKSSQFKFDGGKLEEVRGELTMHGVTRPVTLEVENFVCKDHPMTKKPACGADLEAKIKRSDWGITTYVPAVGDEVTLSIEVEAVKK
ncbi:YceI family protein [Solimonas flava]|uniref:YceI family protein n=1 Tax=Solimonas flava TaxID=415849 RepID=UPI00040C83F7|nr:YceI family protein [Solimonas flava]